MSSIEAGSFYSSGEFYRSWGERGQKNGRMYASLQVLDAERLLYLQNLLQKKNLTDYLIHPSKFHVTLVDFGTFDNFYAIIATLDSRISFRACAKALAKMKEMIESVVDEEAVYFAIGSHLELFGRRQHIIGLTVQLDKKVAILQQDIVEMADHIMYRNGLPELRCVLETDARLAMFLPENYKGHVSIGRKTEEVDVEGLSGLRLPSIMTRLGQRG